ncbi:uncharacterized protein [Rutidosis leptorrhynchoides]|uniref:uncharacterized protein n=1 Tax=Rutidosis leptorrhynchoides TaxID=125765 RepID=UPI003A9A22B8
MDYEMCLVHLFFVNINGELYGYFKGKRELRQSDLMSLYLFTLVMEVLTLLIKRNNIGETDELKYHTLNEFKECLGFTPSLPKSTTVSCNVSQPIKAAIMDLMPFVEGTLPVRHLGVPHVFSALYVKDCKLLVDMVKQWVENWKNEFLSFAWRLQLITSVILSLQVYWSSVFLLSDTVILDIKKILRGFLWCQVELKREKAKIKWKDVSFQNKKVVWV